MQRSWCQGKDRRVPLHLRMPNPPRAFQLPWRPCFPQDPGLRVHLDALVSFVSPLCHRPCEFSTSGLRCCCCLLGCVLLFETTWPIARKAPQSRISQANEMGCHFLLQNSDGIHISCIADSLPLSHRGR